MKEKGSLFCLLRPVHFWSYSGLCHHPVDTTLYYRVEVNCLRGISSSEPCKNYKGLLGSSGEPPTSRSQEHSCQHTLKLIDMYKQDRECSIPPSVFCAPERQKPACFVPGTPPAPPMLRCRLCARGTHASVRSSTKSD